MTIKRREFIGLTGLAATAGLVTGFASCNPGNQKDAAGEALLEPMARDVIPISQSERQARIEKAQRLLTENKMGALVLDAGTGMNYFTGVSWWPSERTMV